MPVYSLFPYWTDLLIAKDMPHGIFWEVTGASPNRSLSIEWYVTRYQHEEQYFHFKVVVDEASPNVVAFEYYDVRDKGAKGTIGVQGPKNGESNAIKFYPPALTPISSSSVLIQQSKVVSRTATSI
ncbi:hypothetical protein BKA65DRAFT_24364 [Rhexocercosporidium sp. MPI-PUGE-AT-0058]|nr:hypothetical protein BKA65DRAFT_24364 [Rhexocercosporidium sp. MPI-PUGE-AT-0058]